MPLVHVHFAPNKTVDGVNRSLVAAIKDNLAAAMSEYGVRPSDVVVACSSSPWNDLGGFGALVLVEPDYTPERADHESDIVKAFKANMEADPRVMLTCDVRVALAQCAWAPVGEAQ